MMEIHTRRIRKTLIAVAVLLAAFAASPLAAQDAPAPGVPSLEERELGEPYAENGEAVVYDRALPFLAQQVLDLGFELPKPYGAQLISYWQEQDLVLDNLFISVNGGEMEHIDFVIFDDPSVENIAAQLKLDAWLFPFMNVYVSLGTFDGDSRVPLGIEGQDLLEYLGLGSLCNGGPLEPPLCKRLLTGVAEPEYEGENITLGTNLAVGWGDWFITLPISYTWSEVDILDETVEATNISPRIGHLWNFEQRGKLALYAGATWLDAEVDAAGTVSFDTQGSGIPSIPDRVVIDYVIRQDNKDRWNYLVGFNWEASDTWYIQAEAGFGGSRSNVIASLTYRW
jgi:hypothetical protein